MSRSVYRQSLAARLPDSGYLAEALTTAFSNGESISNQVDILGRETFPYASTFPSEIVTCRLADDTERRLLCKYGVAACLDSNGHGGGPRYEALVYRHLMRSSSEVRPRFYGEYCHPAVGDTWLFIELLAGGVRLDETSSPHDSLVRAAAWSGRFHAVQHECLTAASIAGLKLYDDEYYARWTRRVTSFATGRTFAWLRRICARFLEEISDLNAGPQTVIHGEFTVHNILHLDSLICPVDWESAAIAPGEIDLASLSEGWPSAVVRDCESAYVKARWPEGAPLAFTRRLNLARAYWSIRWLGHKATRFNQEKNRRRLRRLRRISERLGWIRPSGTEC